MSSETTGAVISRAWRAHREGKAETAISEFDVILKKDPGNVDANYGMGLAQRAVGRKDNAISYFQKALEQVEAETAAAARVHTPGERNTPEDDRHLMLTRMLQQRLSELGAGPT